MRVASGRMRAACGHRTPEAVTEAGVAERPATREGPEQSEMAGGPRDPAPTGLCEALLKGCGQERLFPAESQFPHLQNGIIITPTPQGSLRTCRRYGT